MGNSSESEPTLGAARGKIFNHEGLRRNDEIRMTNDESNPNE
jgi:hypothetical protein